MLPVTDDVPAGREDLLDAGFGFPAVGREEEVHGTVVHVFALYQVTAPARHNPNTHAL